MTSPPGEISQMVLFEASRNGLNFECETDTGRHGAPIHSGERPTVPRRAYRTNPMRYLAALAILISLTGSAGAEALIDTGKRDGFAMVERGDPDMAVAYKRAREGLPEFLRLTREPRPTTKGFSVKVPVPYGSGDDAEFFWIAPFKPQAGKYVGRINNTPRLAKSVKLGQVIEFAEGQIVDWLYLEDGKMIGNFTACALLKREPAASAEAFMKQYGLTCDP